MFQDRAAVVRYLASRLESDRRIDVWSKAIAPWMDRHWPRDQQLKSADVSREILLLLLKVPVVISQAAELLGLFVRPLEDGSYVYSRLTELDIEEKDVPSVLRLLWLTLPRTRVVWHYYRLREALDVLVSKSAASSQSADYREIDKYLRDNGLG